MKTIKTLSIIFLLILMSGKVRAGFTGAKLKVTGVTCSMCSNSVHKALSSLPFIDKVDVDLEKAAFELTFKADVPVSMDQIKDKVEGAGFSVGELTAQFMFSNLAVRKDYHYEYQGNVYHFVDVKEQNLDRLVTVRFVDKGLTSLKEHKKYTRLTSYACIKNGKSQNCCNVKEGQRIYHVTL